MGLVGDSGLFKKAVAAIYTVNRHMQGITEVRCSPGPISCSVLGGDMVAPSWEYLRGTLIRNDVVANLTRSGLLGVNFTSNYTRTHSDFPTKASLCESSAGPNGNIVLSGDHPYIL